MEQLRQVDDMATKIRHPPSRPDHIAPPADEIGKDAVRVGVRLGGKLIAASQSAHDRPGKFVQDLVIGPPFGQITGDRGGNGQNHRGRDHSIPT